MIKFIFFFILFISPPIGVYLHYTNKIKQLKQYINKNAKHLPLLLQNHDVKLGDYRYILINNNDIQKLKIIGIKLVDNTVKVTVLPDNWKDKLYNKIKENEDLSVNYNKDFILSFYTYVNYHLSSCKEDQTIRVKATSLEEACDKFIQYQRVIDLVSEDINLYDTYNSEQEAKDAMLDTLNKQFDSKLKSIESEYYNNVNKLL